MGANFDTKSAADTAFSYDRSILVPLFKLNGFLTDWADTDTGTANPSVNPGVAGATIDLSYTHIDGIALRRGQGFGRADFHAFTAQGAGTLFRIDIRCIDLPTTIALVELYASRWTNFATKTAADTGRDESPVIF